MVVSSSPTHRSRIFAWTLFDFGNTAFSVIIVTVVYSQYFIDNVAGGRLSLWGLAVSLSMICAAVLSPPLGAAADFSHKRKQFLFFFTIISVLCTALLFFVEQGMVVAGILLFVLANIGFEGGLVFYDAFLPSLTAKSSYGRVSGYGFAMGYLGALAVLVVVNMMVPEPSNLNYLFFVRLSFVVAGGFFLLFSLPLFLFVPEPIQATARKLSYLKEGIKQAGRTFQALFVRKEHPQVARFLIAFFIYNDGILTIITFAGVFATHVLHMDLSSRIVFFAIVQTSAVLGSVVFGIVTDKAGPKKTITMTLVLWIIVSIGAFFVTTVMTFYVVAMIAGIAIGSSQSASRSMMALLTPRDREAEFFGFYDGLCGKASAVIGPFIYGLTADLTNERFAALMIGVFFIVGLFILQGIKEPEKNIGHPIPA